MKGFFVLRGRGISAVGLKKKKTAKVNKIVNGNNYYTTEFTFRLTYVNVVIYIIINKPSSLIYSNSPNNRPIN